MNYPAISVLMPAYNVEKYIGEAIDSILNQTFINFEFIIIDDASSDSTLAVINKYKDARLLVLHNEINLGPAASRNKGMAIVRGKYIAAMDADDISHPHRLQKLYDFLEKNPNIDICGTTMQLFGQDNTVWEYQTRDEEIKAGLIWTSTMPYGTVLMRRDKILKYGLFYDESLRVGSDWQYWYDIKDYVTFSNLTELLYFYRRDQQSITIQFSHQARDRYAVMHRLMLSDIGISFVEHELLLHQFIVGIFTIVPSAKAVNEARAWINKLVSHNRIVKKYDPVSFEKIAAERWNYLFFKIIPFGLGPVLAYFVVSGFSFTYLMYYIKHLAGGISFKKNRNNERK